MLNKNGYNEKTKYDLYIWEENGNVEKQINNHKYYKKYLWNKFIVEIKDEKKKEERKEIKPENKKEETEEKDKKKDF